MRATLAGGIATLVVLARSVGCCRRQRGDGRAPLEVLEDGGATPRRLPGTRARGAGVALGVAAPGEARARDGRVGRRERRLGVCAARRGRLLYSDSGGRARILASNSKLFTTAAFLDRFGPDGRLATGSGSGGHRGGAARRRSCTAARVWSATATRPCQPRLRQPAQPAGGALKPLARSTSEEAGIRRGVKGRLLADPTMFDSQRSVPQPGIAGGPWLSSLSGLSYNSGFDGGRYASEPPRGWRASAFVQALRRARREGRRGGTVGGAPTRVFEEPPLDRVRSPRGARADQADQHTIGQLLRRDAAQAPRGARQPPGHDRARRREGRETSREASAAAPTS